MLAVAQLTTGQPTIRDGVTVAIRHHRTPGKATVACSPTLEELTAAAQAVEMLPPGSPRPPEYERLPKVEECSGRVLACAPFTLTQGPWRDDPKLVNLRAYRVQLITGPSKGRRLWFLEYSVRAK